MAHHVCPWWLGYLLANPVRKLFQDPVRILAPHVHEGMTVLEPGPGMGFFTLELARRVGPRGQVVAVDIQERMLAGLLRRARRAGLAERIEARLASGSSLGIEDLTGKVDLALAFALVHELPDGGRFFAEVRRAMAPGGRVLLAEPSGHVSAADFETTLAIAERAGFRRQPGPDVARSLTALLSC
jgi:ubiquinone/menaquinone biosynthesis C-methylase UbiE